MESLKFERAKAFLIDFLICCLCASPIDSIIDTIKYGTTIRTFSLGGVALIFMIFRDFIFNGASIGKRLFGIRVGNASEPRLPVKKSKQILRNLTALIYPVEMIYILIKDRRIGDEFTDTRIYHRDYI